MKDGVCSESKTEAHMQQGSPGLGAGPLSEADIATFLSTGAVRLPGAIPASTCTALLEGLDAYLAEHKGISLGDPSTYPATFSIATASTPTFLPWSSARYGDVMTPLLLAAIDQLCGAGRWAAPDAGLGWFPIAYPDGTAKDWLWHTKSGGWHVDGGHFQHFLDSPELTLLPILLLTDCTPTQGPTALISGSHVGVARALQAAHLNGGMSEADLKGIVRPQYNELLSGPDDQRVIRAVGRVGDVWLTHPFIVHASSRNLTSAPRVISNFSIRLTDGRLRVGSEWSDAERSPVERAIVWALNKDER
jgi:hypothetical protein